MFWIHVIIPEAYKPQTDVVQYLLTILCNFRDNNLGVIVHAMNQNLYLLSSGLDFSPDNMVNKLMMWYACPRHAKLSASPTFTSILYAVMD